MSNDRSPIPEQIKTQFFIFDQRLKQLQHDQLSRYFQIWVLSIESILSGFGIVILLIGSYIAATHGIAAAYDAIIPTLHLAILSVILLTILLRVIWFAATGLFPPMTTGIGLDESQE